jgi:hypothetical protein
MAWACRTSLSAVVQARRLSVCHLCAIVCQPPGALRGRGIRPQPRSSQAPTALGRVELMQKTLTLSTQAWKRHGQPAILVLAHPLLHAVCRQTERQTL